MEKNKTTAFKPRIIFQKIRLNLGLKMIHQEKKWMTYQTLVKHERGESGEAAVAPVSMHQ